MDGQASRQAGSFLRTKKRMKTWHKVVTVMAAIVVFCTTYALILPAITLSTSDNNTVAYQPVTTEYSVALYPEGSEGAMAVSLPQDEHALLRVDSGMTSYQWQVYSPETEAWTDIFQDDAQSCEVYYAKLLGMLDANDTAQVRALALNSGVTYVSDTVKITLTAPAGEGAAPAALSEEPDTYDVVFDDSGSPMAYDVPAEELDSLNPDAGVASVSFLGPEDDPYAISPLSLGDKHTLTVSYEGTSTSAVEFIYSDNGDGEYVFDESQNTGNYNSISTARYSVIFQQPPEGCVAVAYSGDTAVAVAGMELPLTIDEDLTYTVKYVEGYAVKIRYAIEPQDDSKTPSPMSFVYTPVKDENEAVTTYVFSEACNPVDTYIKEEKTYTDENGVTQTYTVYSAVFPEISGYVAYVKLGTEEEGAEQADPSVNLTLPSETTDNVTYTVTYRPLRYTVRVVFEDPDGIVLQDQWSASFSASGETGSYRVPINAIPGYSVSLAGGTPTYQYQMDDNGNYVLDDNNNKIIATDEAGNQIVLKYTASDGAVLDTQGMYLELPAIISSNITYVVVDTPMNVRYTVEHYLQNLDGTTYTLDAKETMYGPLGSTVPSVAKEYTGYTKLAYVRPTIAGDGNTVVQVYYDRNYYKLLFNLDGGTGATDLYVQYGTDISVDNPTKAGYTFANWVETDKDGNILYYLDENNDGAPDEDEDGHLIPAEKGENGAENHRIPNSMRSIDMYFLATWTPSTTTYSIMIWREKTDGLSYTYYDHIQDIEVETGTVISVDPTYDSNNDGDAEDETDGFSAQVKDKINEFLQNDSDDDYAMSKYFALNEDMSKRYNGTDSSTGNGDGLVTVAGDGSTVINIYFNRNRYTLRFYYARSTDGGVTWQMSQSNEGYSKQTYSTAADGTTWKEASVSATDYPYYYDISNGCKWVDAPYEPYITQDYLELFNDCYLKDSDGNYVDQSGKPLAQNAAKVLKAVFLTTGDPQTIPTTTNNQTVSYTYKYFDLTAIYGASIVDYWPVPGVVTTGESADSWTSKNWGTNYSSPYLVNAREVDPTKVEPNIFIYGAMDNLLVMDPTTSYWTMDEDSPEEHNVSHSLVVYADDNEPTGVKYQFWMEALASDIEAAAEDDIVMRTVTVNDKQVDMQFVRKETVEVQKNDLDTGISSVQVPAFSGFETPVAKAGSETVTSGDPDSEGNLVWNFYYVRERYKFKFDNGYNGRMVAEVPYGESLDTYLVTPTMEASGAISSDMGGIQSKLAEVTPLYPINLPRSLVYDESGNLTTQNEFYSAKTDASGNTIWYMQLDEEKQGVEGTEFDFNTTMGLHDVLVYASFVPNTYTATYHWNLPDSATAGIADWNDIYATENFDYGDKLQGVPDPEFGQYQFLGWYYVDQGSYGGVQSGLSSTATTGEYAVSVSSSVTDGLKAGDTTNLTATIWKKQSDGTYTKLSDTEVADLLVSGYQLVWMNEQQQSQLPTGDIGGGTEEGTGSNSGTTTNDPTDPSSGENSFNITYGNYTVKVNLAVKYDDGTTKPLYINETTYTATAESQWFTFGTEGQVPTGKTISQANIAPEIAGYQYSEAILTGSYTNTLYSVSPYDTYDGKSGICYYYYQNNTYYQYCNSETTNSYTITLYYTQGTGSNSGTTTPDPTDPSSGANSFTIKYSTTHTVTVNLAVDGTTQPLYINDTTYEATEASQWFTFPVGTNVAQVPDGKNGTPAVPEIAGYQITGAELTGSNGTYTLHSVSPYDTWNYQTNQSYTGVCYYYGDGPTEYSAGSTNNDNYQITLYYEKDGTTDTGDTGNTGGTGVPDIPSIPGGAAEGNTDAQFATGTDTDGNPTGFVDPAVGSIVAELTNQTSVTVQLPTYGPYFIQAKLVLTSGSATTEYSGTATLYAGQERRIDFETTSFTNGNVDIYAKWNDIVYIGYTVHHYLVDSSLSDDEVKRLYEQLTSDTATSEEKAYAMAQLIAYDSGGNPIMVADDTVGQLRAGLSLSVTAKNQTELYEKYRSGFYVLGSSTGTLLMDITSTEVPEYAFFYIAGKSVPYKVQYLTMGENGPIKLADDKIVWENTNTVVTETALNFTGYTLMPPFGQTMPNYEVTQILVHPASPAPTPDLPPGEETGEETGNLPAENPDFDEDGIHYSNIITFFYTKDQETQQYSIRHYVQNPDGTYRVYSVIQATGTAGTLYEAEHITIPGYTLNEDAADTQKFGYLSSKPTDVQAGDTNPVINLDGEDNDEDQSIGYLRLYYDAVPVAVTKTWFEFPAEQRFDVTMQVYLVNEKDGTVTPVDGTPLTLEKNSFNETNSETGETSNKGTMYLPTTDYWAYISEDPNDIADNYHYVLAEARADGLALNCNPSYKGNAVTGMERVKINSKYVNVAGIQLVTDGAINITNTPIYELPSSGGPGTYLFTFGGALLMAAAALMYGYMRRRRERRSID